MVKPRFTVEQMRGVRFNKNDLLIVAANMEVKAGRTTPKEDKKFDIIRKDIRSGKIKTLRGLEGRAVRSFPKGRIGLR